jgi:hypothetical protein
MGGHMSLQRVPEEVNLAFKRIILPYLLSLKILRAKRTLMRSVLQMPASMAH